MYIDIQNFYKHKYRNPLINYICQMENLTEDEYELVLKYMQETNEQNFQTAFSHLSKHHFNLQMTINSLHSTVTENDDSLYQEEEMIRMKKYLLKKTHQPIPKTKFAKAVEGCKKFVSRMCLNLTEKIMPEMIKRKVIRSQFHCLYHNDSSTSLLYRSFEQAIFDAKQKRKHLLTIISEGNKNSLIAKFLRNKKLLLLVHFIIFGVVGNELDGTLLERARGPKLAFLRENKYEEFQILQEINEGQIPNVDQEKINHILSEANKKLGKQKQIMSRTALSMIPEVELDASTRSINLSMELEDESQNYIRNVRSSKMIKEQNRAYEQMVLQRSKKEEEQAQKTKFQEEMREQRQVRKMSIPQEPSEVDIARIAFRCPNGQTITRNFNKNQKLQLLYCWVDLNDDIEFEQRRQFDLFYSYPPESLSSRKQDLLGEILEEDQGKIMIRQL